MSVSVTADKILVRTLKEASHEKDAKLFVACPAQQKPVRGKIAVQKAGGY